MEELFWFVREALAFAGVSRLDSCGRNKATCAEGSLTSGI